MNRTQFLHTILSACVLGSPGLGAGAFNEPVIQPGFATVPKYLLPGDTIAITCPGGALEASQLEGCICTLQSWGFKTRLGASVGAQWQRFGGTDAARAADLQSFLDDDSIAAILFGRGGYGSIRILDSLNWSKFSSHPKWLVGFSDITAFHCHVNTLYSIPTLHAPMANGFSLKAAEAVESIRLALTGKLVNYVFEGSVQNVCGQANATLVGGNLSLIYAMQASKSELSTEGRILLIEDVGEFKYTIDRMLMNLKRSGKLEHLAALVVGGMPAKRDEETDFSMEVAELVLEKVREYKYPVCFNFPAGHQSRNLAVKLGVAYQLTVGKTLCNISETSA